MRWFIVEKETRQGPFDVNALREKLRLGELSLDSIVLREGSTVKRRLISVVEVFSDLPDQSSEFGSSVEKTQVASLARDESRSDTDTEFGADRGGTAVSMVSKEDVLPFELSINPVQIDDKGVGKAESEDSAKKVSDRGREISKSLSFSISLLNQQKKSDSSEGAKKPYSVPNLDLKEEKESQDSTQLSKVASQKDTKSWNLLGTAEVKPQVLQPKRSRIKEAVKKTEVLQEAESPKREKSKESSAERKEKGKPAKNPISVQPEKSVIALDLLDMATVVAKRRENSREGSRVVGTHYERRSNRPSSQWQKEARRDPGHQGVVRDLATVALVSAVLMAIVAVVSFMLLSNAKIKEKFGFDNASYQIGGATPDGGTSPYPVVQNNDGIAVPNSSLQPPATRPTRPSLPPLPVRKQSFSAKPLEHRSVPPPKNELKAELKRPQKREDKPKEVPLDWPRPIVRIGGEMPRQGSQPFSLQNVFVRNVPAKCAPCRVSGTLSDGTRVLLLSPGGKQWSILGSSNRESRVNIKGKVLRKTPTETWILVQGIGLY